MQATAGFRFRTLRWRWCGSRCRRRGRCRPVEVDIHPTVILLLRTTSLSPLTETVSSSISVIPCLGSFSLLLPCSTRIVGRSLKRLNCPFRKLLLLKYASSSAVFSAIRVWGPLVRDHSGLHYILYYMMMKEPSFLLSPKSWFWLSWVGSIECGPTRTLDWRLRKRQLASIYVGGPHLSP